MKKLLAIISPVIRSHFLNNHARKFARFIANDKIVSLDNNTVTGRLMIYLKPETTEDTPKTENLKRTELLNLIKYQRFDDVSNTGLISFIGCLEDENIIKSNRKFFNILRLVDEECCSRQVSLGAKEILNYLDAYMELIPHKVTQLKFYDKAIDQLYSLKDTLKGKEYMKFLFYVALLKKNVKGQKILKKTLSILKEEDIKELTSEDLCIIANSTFKTSTRITNKNILNKIKSYLNDNLMLLKDPAIFVTLIKCLRQNRFCDEDLLATISCALFFNKAFECYTFQTYCHLLALYSDNLYYDENLLEFISKRCIEEIKLYPPCNTANKNIRSKDLVRFLWGMSNLNTTFLRKEDLDIIVSTIEQFIESSDLDINTVVDIFWYLWILNHKCYRLVPYLLKNRKYLDQIPDKTNTRQRLNQLLVCIYHEDRPLFDKLGLKPNGKPNFILSQHLKNRPCLQDLMRVLNTLGNKMKMRFELGYQIPHMNILGITGYEKNIYKSVHIEVLDHFTTLANSNGRPSGLMQTKLRILDGSEEALVVVNKNEIEDLTESQLEEFLEDELNLVC